MKKVFITLFIISFGFIICKAHNKSNKENMFGFFKKGDPIEKFWEWFKQNEKRLRNFQENPDRYITEVFEQARKVKPGLAIEFEPPKNGIINMTISANGDKNLFDVVKKIAAHAPTIDGWHFFAFRQRIPQEYVKGMKLKAQDHELDPDKMKFFPIINGDSLDMIIYVNGLSEENYNQVAYGGFLLLDNILGEYDCVTKVRKYDFQNMPVKKEELEELLPLLELPAYVDKFYGSKK